MIELVIFDMDGVLIDSEDAITLAAISGALLVIDRSLIPHTGDIVVAFYNQEFTMKYYDDSHLADEGYIELRPANPKYPVFKITSEQTDFRVWGVVIYTIKQRRNDAAINK